MSSQDIPAHPFRTEHIFFPDVRVKRADKLPPDLNLQFSWQIALGTEDDPTLKRFNALLKLSSSKESRETLDVRIVTVAISTYLEEGEAAPQKVAAYLNGLLLPAMVSRVIQLVATLTAQMGMAPIWLPTPRGFGFDPSIVGTLGQGTDPKVSELKDIEPEEAISSR